MTTTQILLADDHVILREGLRLMIERDPTMRVCAEVGTIREAVWTARTHTPDLVLLDFCMPGGAAIPAIQEMVAMTAAPRVIVLSMHDDPAIMRSVIAVGAAGYVIKQSPHAVLIEALRAVRAGRLYIDPSFPSSDREPATARTPLSPRERDVLALLARGLTYREAGERLCVGERTIETHRRHIADKLGLKTRADLLRYALDTGLLASDER